MFKTACLLLLAAATNSFAQTHPAAVEAAMPAASTAAYSATISTMTIRAMIMAERPVRGIHLSSWGAGSKPLRRELIKKIKKSVINTVVVAVTHNKKREVVL